MNGSSDPASESVAHSDAVRVAERYVGAYADRDLDAMLAVMDEKVVSHPAPLFGHRPHYGHAGVLRRGRAVRDRRPAQVIGRSAGALPARRFSARRSR
jgi:hypothetical protein